MQKQLLLLLFLLLALGSLNAQSFQMPEEFTIEEKGDYIKYDSIIIEASKWLHNTGLYDQPDKRKKVTFLITKWLDGNLAIKIEAPAIIKHFDHNNPGMLVLYLAGCSQYVLEKKDTTNVRAMMKYGVVSLTGPYNASRGKRQDAKMQKLINAMFSNKLEDWIDKNIKIEAKN
jgi:hypothetical protein